MIHNKQYYIDKYDKAWNKVKSEIEKGSEYPEVVGVTEEWEQTDTPEEIVGYYLYAYEDEAYRTWLDNLSYRREDERELYEESDREVTSIFKDLEDLEVINNYILNVVDGNGKNNDRLMNVHEYINERLNDKFNASDVLLTNMSNSLLNSMSALTGEDLDSIFLTYDYKTDKASAYLSNDYTADDYPIELNKETIEKVEELFKDAIRFKQEYEIHINALENCYYHPSYYSTDEWGDATLWLTEDFGVEYNYYSEQYGEHNSSAIYVMKYDSKKDNWYTDYDNYTSYEINCNNTNWTNDLKNAMYKFAVEKYKAEHKETKGDDNVNETKKETTTETKGNTVYVTIYDGQEDPMLSSAGLRTTTEISFDNVRGITYKDDRCIIWYNDTNITFRIKEIAMITFSNK